MEINGWEVDRTNVARGLKHPSRILDEVVADYLFRVPVTLLNGHRTIGTNVFDRDWDVLVLLDTCRVDALRQVQDEYDFLDDIGHIWSVGGSSPEWVARTFDSDHLDEIGRTAYLSANSHAQTILDTRQQDEDGRHLTFRMLRNFPTVGVEALGKAEYVFTFEPMGEDGPLGHRNGGTPPRYVTERVIAVGRQEEYDRIILHYFQPHSPWVASAMAEERDLEPHEEGFTYLTETGDRAGPWNAYLEDLRWVLDDVELLLENIDADRVAISADHGDAFGEYGVMSHKIGSLHPHIRKVPWVVTEGIDSRTHTPTVEDPGASAVDADEVDRQLRALGYKT